MLRKSKGKPLWITHLLYMPYFISGKGGVLTIEDGGRDGGVRRGR